MTAQSTLATVVDELMHRMDSKNVGVINTWQPVEAATPVSRMDALRKPQRGHRLADILTISQ